MGVCYKKQAPNTIGISPQTYQYSDPTAHLEWEDIPSRHPKGSTQRPTWVSLIIDVLALNVIFESMVVKFLAVQIDFDLSCTYLWVKNNKENQTKKNKMLEK